MGLGGPGGPTKTWTWLGKTWEAGCMSPGSSALLSAMSCDTAVGLCGNCGKHGGGKQT